MAAESYRKRLRDEGTCSVCLDYFRDPVTLDCGHNFCRTCVDNSWGEAPRLAACPQCRERVRAKKLKPNRQLANMVQLAKDLSSLPENEVERRETCQGPLKLFCTDGEGRVCLLCDGSREPRAYRVLSVEEAVQECKVGAPRSLLCIAGAGLVRSGYVCDLWGRTLKWPSLQPLLRRSGRRREMVALGALSQILPIKVLQTRVWIWLRRLARSQAFHQGGTNMRNVQENTTK